MAAGGEVPGGAAQGLLIALQGQMSWCLHCRVLSQAVLQLLLQTHCGCCKPP